MTITNLFANPLLWSIGISYLIITSTIVRIFVRDNRSPASRVAWIVVIAALPYLGALIYFIFGEVNLGKKINARLATVWSALKREVPDQYWGDYAVAEATLPADYRDSFKLAQSINGFQAVTGNRVELMQDNDETLSRMLADIHTATHSVHLLYYIWLTDNTGTAIAHAVIEAAKRGVTCRVMADGLGSRQLIKSALWQSMKDAGVQQEVALPIGSYLKMILTSRLDLRNHRKITLIDGSITYCGSQNCADAAFSPKPKYAPWVDIMLRVEGPVVDQNQILFASDWLLHNEQESFADLDTRWHTTEPGHTIAQVVADGPTDRPAAMPQLLGTLFASAKTKICVVTPYFVPSESLVENLTAASFRGVDVSLVLPHRNDSTVVALTAQSHYKELLNSGIRLFTYKGGLLHAKICCIDDSISLIGSSNLDRRSFDLNYENNMLFFDTALTTAILQRTNEYIAASEEVHLESVEQWRLPRRMANNFFAMISPIL